MPNFVSLPNAVKLLARANRVLVVGCSGGGKTTLALHISDAFNLAYQSFDRDVRWLPDWQVRDRKEQREIVSRLAGQNRWIMDGNSPSTFDIRVPRADLIIWVRVPRAVALLGVARRVLSNYGRVRVAMAKGCPEPIPDREFLSYVWNFEQQTAPRFVYQIDQHGPEVPVVVVRSHQDGSQLH